MNDKFPKTHPHAARIFKKLSFTTSQIGAMADLVDTDKMTHEELLKNGLLTMKLFGSPGPTKI
ncbi:MAG: hypothetical protein Ct9H300mP28_13920 [Pseudomonadota bacterium]|nr:MAG: hypothetical protein Ct9H300mP28_13920 [Pseudomonadota bacterium]